DGRSYVPCGREAAQGDLFAYRLDLLLGEHRVPAPCPQAGRADRVVALRDHQSRADDVGPDAVPAVLLGHGPGQRDDSRLGGAVDALAGLTECRVAGYEHD